MKLMKRNLKPVHYCLYKGREPLLDDDGNETGDTRWAMKALLNCNAVFHLRLDMPR